MHSVVVEISSQREPCQKKGFRASLGRGMHGCGSCNRNDGSVENGGFIED